MILRWWDARDGSEHETPVDYVEVCPDGTVEGYRYMPVPTAETHISKMEFVGVQQLAPSDVQGRVLVVA